MTLYRRFVHSLYVVPYLSVRSDHQTDSRKRVGKFIILCHNSHDGFSQGESASADVNNFAVFKVFQLMLAVYHHNNRPHLIVVAFLFLCPLLCGCRTGDRDFPPTEVAQMFYDGLLLFSQEQFEDYQEASFGLLCADDQKHLTSLADTLNEALPEHSRIKPHQLLVATSPVFGSHVQSAKTISTSENEAIVELTVENGTIPVRLVREESKWRIDLPDNMEKSDSHQDVPTSESGPATP